MGEALGRTELLAFLNCHGRVRIGRLGKSSTTLRLISRTYILTTILRPIEGWHSRGFSGS